MANATSSDNRTESDADTIGAACSKEALQKARARASVSSNIHPYGILVHFDPIKGKVVVAFNDGTEFAFPPNLAEGLENATSDQLSKVEITPSGLELRWKSLDVDLSIPGLMSGVYGSKSWMKALAQKGGQSTSKRKSKAARENGKKGGRPRKKTA